MWCFLATKLYWPRIKTNTVSNNILLFFNKDTLATKEIYACGAWPEGQAVKQEKLGLDSVAA
jgi:hypothetical protein